MLFILLRSDFKIKAPQFNFIVAYIEITTIGRKKGSVKTIEQKKEEYKEVISFLKRGYSVRNTATLSNVNVSTVQRVKREFGI